MTLPWLDRKSRVFPPQKKTGLCPEIPWLLFGGVSWGSNPQRPDGDEEIYIRVPSK